MLNLDELVRRVTVSNDEDWSISRLLTYLLGFFIIFFFILYFNRDWLSAPWDSETAYAIWSYMQRAYRPFGNNVMDPIAGMFDIYASAWRVGFLQNFLTLILVGPDVSPWFYLFGNAVLMTCSVMYFARVVGFSRGVSALAGMIFPVVLMQLSSVAPAAEHFYVLAPAAYYLSAAAMFMLAIYWNVGRVSRKESAIRTIIIILILIHIGNIMILFIIIPLFAVVVVGSASLIACRSRRELKVKLVSAVTISGAFIASGLFTYLLDLGSYSAYQTFFDELKNAVNMGSASFRHQFIPMFISYLNLNTSSIERFLVLSSLLGGLLVAVAGPTRDSRVVAWTVLLWAFLSAALFHFAHFAWHYFGIVYKGPWFEHFGSMFWPFYAIFSAFLAVFVLGVLVSWGAKAMPHPKASALANNDTVGSRKIVGSQGFAVAAFMVVVLISVISNAQPYGREAGRDSIANPVTDYLQERVAYAPDTPFRGRVLTLSPLALSRHDRVVLGQSLTIHSNAKYYLGNDMANVGLWKFNIPTLMSFSHLTTPQFFLMTSEFLSRRERDWHSRGYSLLTLANPKILQLWGVRYVVSDDVHDFGQKRMEWEIPESVAQVDTYRESIKIYELPDANVGQYSPTEVVTNSTAAETIEEMRRPWFDGRRTVIVDKTLTGQFVPAHSTIMSVNSDGLTLQAISEGESLLVLPAEYSNCWRIRGQSKAELFRANLMQLGVRFEGKLDIELEYDFSPFWGSSCRGEDAEDAARLELVYARHLNRGGGGHASVTPPPPVVNGDGENLLADALEKNPPFSAANASVATEKREHPELGRVYRITANGKDTQYYMSTGLQDSEPGYQTFSLWVDSRSARSLRIQLLDKTLLGIWADIDLDNQSAVITNLNSAGSVAFLEEHEGWVHLAVSAELSDSKVYALVQFLHPRSNADTFTARDQQIRFAKPRLEYGTQVAPAAGQTSVN